MDLVKEIAGNARYFFILLSSAVGQWIACI
jgi:hypothetical protein